MASEKRRERKAKERRSYEGRRQEDAARDLDRQLRGWSRRRWACRLLFVLAGVIVVQHLFAHSGWRPLPISMGWQDLLVGYPMAAVMAVVALIVLGNTPSPR
jgi:hypothetical protein